MGAPRDQAGPPKADGTQFSLTEGNTARCDIPTPTKPHQTVGTLGLARTPDTLGCAGTPGRGTWVPQSNGTEGDNPSFPKAGEAPYLGIIMDLHPPGEGRRIPSFSTWPEETPRPTPFHSSGPVGIPQARDSPCVQGWAPKERQAPPSHSATGDPSGQGRRAEDPPQKGTLWRPLPSTPWARGHPALPLCPPPQKGIYEDSWGPLLLSADDPICSSLSLPPHLPG